MMGKHTPEENRRRLAAIDADLALMRRERSIAAKERALDVLEQSNRRARWFAAKTRALEILNDTPEKKEARAATARAKETIARINRKSRGWQFEAETNRFIAGEIARQRRERWKP
jgi:hypothetical protein